MALRPAPKRKLIEYQKLDELQREVFDADERAPETIALPPMNESAAAPPAVSDAKKPARKSRPTEKSSQKSADDNANAAKKSGDLKKRQPAAQTAPADAQTTDENELLLGAHLSDLETIARGIVNTKAGQGRQTTRPFSIPRTIIIDTTRLKSKFRTIDEQFTQNVIVDFLLKEALAAVTPENYKTLRAKAFESVKRPEEITRRSLTVTEDAIYQMSELKAGINLETNRKYSNDEILSTLLALAVSWLYRSNILS